MGKADVIVAGLGALGAAAARAAARRGLRVVGLDPRRPPHAEGSSHGGSRIIRRVYAEGALYVPLVERAYAAWGELEAQRGERLLLPAGGLFVGGRDSALVVDALACARQLDLEHRLLSAAEMRRRFPLRAPPGTCAVLDPRAGVLRAEACVEALLAGATAAGAELRLGSALRDWRSDGDGVTVDTAAGTLRAGHLVLATGAWLADRAEGGRLRVERQVQSWFEAPAADLGPANLPPFVWELADGGLWYAIPDLGRGVKAAFHHGGETTTADSVRRRVDSAEIEAVRSLLARHLPGAAGPCRGSRVCLYANSPDQRFLAGPLAAAPRVWLLGGGSGHAFKFAPALGELVAEGIAAGSAPVGLAPFLPTRPDLTLPRV